MEIDARRAKNIESIANGITRGLLVLMDRGIIPGFIPSKELDSNQIRDGIRAAIVAAVEEIADE